MSVWSWTSRRGFLRRALAGLGALAGGVWLGTAGRRARGEEAARSTGVRGALEAYFGASRFEAAARIGRVALAQHPEASAFRAEVSELAEAAAGRAPEQTAAVWRRQVASEFAALQTASVANWQLAPSELRLCALAALAGRE
jgi:hypothetical protein